MPEEIIFPDLEYIYTWNYRYDWMILGRPIIIGYGEPLWEFGFTGFVSSKEHEHLYKGYVNLKLNGLLDYKDCVIIEKIEKC